MAMTVADLIFQLSLVKDKDKVIVMSIDPEGNGYRLLSDIDENSAFNDGEIKLQTLSKSLERQGYRKEDVAPKSWTPAVVLLPS